METKKKNARQTTPKKKVTRENTQKFYLPKIRITENEYESNILAFVSLTFNGVFACNGFTVVRGESGLFVSGPSIRDKNGDFVTDDNGRVKSYSFPTSTEYREFLYGEIIRRFIKQTGYTDEESEELDEIEDDSEE